MSIRKVSRLLLSAAVVLGVSAPAAFAVDAKGSGTFAWLATGDTFPMEGQHLYFVGLFSGPVFMDDPTHPANNTTMTCPGTNEPGIRAGGYCIATDAAGDKVFMSWECSHSDVPQGALDACEGTTKITGGTGKFAKATGGSHFTTVLLPADPGGHNSGYSKLTDFEISY